MNTEFELGDTVRVIRNLRDDGSYPGAARGLLLVRRGSVGTVVDIGIFLGDQVIYAVHFLDAGRMVGCRAEELIPADAAWVPSRFESRERVRSLRALAVDGEVRVAPGAAGEILKVVRDAQDGVAYHVHFATLPGRPLIVRENALAPLHEAIPEAASHV